MSDFLNLEPYNYHFIYPDDYDEHEDPSTVSVELDDLSVVDTVDITSGLILQGQSYTLMGDYILSLHTKHRSLMTMLVDKRFYYTTINFHTINSPLNEWDIVY